MGSPHAALHARVAERDGMMPMLDLRQDARAALPALGHYPENLREMALATWRGRMVNEHGSALVFEGLATQLETMGAPQELVVTCRGFAEEERRHGALCGAVVEALGGEARAQAPEQDPFPVHNDAHTVREAALRNMISICCLSETVAVSLIGAERLDMPEGPLRELLTEIYADEVGHARFGWAHLAGMLDGDAQLATRLSNYLRVAFGHLEHHELSHLPIGAAPPPEGAVLGLCSGEDARRLFYETVEQVIVPGLQASGLTARRAWDERIPPTH